MAYYRFADIRDIYILIRMVVRISDTLEGIIINKHPFVTP